MQSDVVTGRQRKSARNGYRQILDCDFGVFHLAQNLFCVRQQDLSNLGQADPLTDTIKQAAAYHLLENSNTFTDSRLGKM